MQDKLWKTFNITKLRNRFSQKILYVNSLCTSQLVIWHPPDLQVEASLIKKVPAVTWMSLPEFCAMMNATLLVPGCIRMKPHSLCSGFLVSAWKALNLSNTVTARNQLKSVNKDYKKELGTFLLGDWHRDTTVNLKLLIGFSFTEVEVDNKYTYTVFPSLSFIHFINLILNCNFSADDCLVSFCLHCFHSK